MFSILFAEDDDQLRKTIVDYLRAKGIKVLPARNGSEAVDSFYDNDPDLIVLDVMMPIMNGTEVCRIIRRRNKTVPILFLTAMSQERDYLNGFKCGCDDYIVKPYTLAVLKAHVEAVLKRAGKMDQFLEAGELRLDLPGQKVYRKGEYVETTRREYELLQYFVENQGRVLKREHILDAVWGFDYAGETRTVDTMVKQLRKKLTDECNYIRSVYGVGYIFEAEADEGEN